MILQQVFDCVYEDKFEIKKRGVHKETTAFARGTIPPMGRALLADFSMKAPHDAALAFKSRISSQLSFLEIVGWLLFPIGVGIWELSKSKSRSVATFGVVLAFIGLLIVIVILSHNFSVLAR